MLHTLVLNIRILFISIAGLFLFVSCLTFASQTPTLSTSVLSTVEKPAKLPIQQRNLVILQYHHVSNDTPKSTSLSPAVFEEHMALLAANYKVIGLDTALNKIRAGEVLPDKSVAITFDDGYTNILENAHPILEKFGFEYTVFVNPAIIGDSSSQLTWEQVKSMQPLATFANHTLDHAHLLEKYGNENQQQWLERVVRDVEQSEALLESKVGYSLKWLAYPYGEYNLALKNALIESGYVGFGQQSGAVSNNSDFGALPRFPAAGIYANIKSLTVKLDSLAMPIEDFSPRQVEYKSDDVLSHLSITVTEPDVRFTQFACYFKGEKLKFIGNSDTIKIVLNHTMQAGRARVNCTAPSNTLNNRYYWFSYPMFTATHDGEYLD